MAIYEKKFWTFLDLQEIFKIWIFTRKFSKLEGLQIFQNFEMSSFFWFSKFGDLQEIFKTFWDLQEIFKSWIFTMTFQNLEIYKFYKFLCFSFFFNFHNLEIYKKFLKLFAIFLKLFNLFFYKAQATGEYRIPQSDRHPDSKPFHFPKTIRKITVINPVIIQLFFYFVNFIES